MPDTNVWAYLVDSDAIESLKKESKRVKVTIAACPAVVFEFLRADHVEVKKRRILALTRGYWTRLMPEAYKEAEEVRCAIKMHRPEWINPNPDLVMWHKLRSDWQQGWWRRVRMDPEREAQQIRRIEEDRIDRARSESAESRERFRRGTMTFDRLSFDSTAIPLGDPPMWWDGEPFDAWRGSTPVVFGAALEERKGAYVDWLGPWLLPLRFGPRDWGTLWLRDVTMEEMPLAWLRWAFDLVQLTRAGSNGAPVDNQIATYLPECDVFVTADKVFAASVERVRPHSPVSLGRGVRVPANEAAVDAVFSLMRDMAS